MATANEARWSAPRVSNVRRDDPPSNSPNVFNLNAHRFQHALAAEVFVVLDGANDGRMRARRRPSSINVRTLDDVAVRDWIFVRLTAPWGLGLEIREGRTKKNALDAIQRAITAVGRPKKDAIVSAQSEPRRDAYCDVLRVFGLPVWGVARTLRRTFADREAADRRFFQQHGRWPKSDLRGDGTPDVWGWRLHVSDREAALLLAK